MAWTTLEVRELKEGRYMMIDEEPCRILSIQTSKPGKHGEAKARGREAWYEGYTIRIAKVEAAARFAR